MMNRLSNKNLDNEIQEVINPLPEGVYRIDRDPEVFQILLNYGRYGRITGVPDHVTEDFVLQEVEFYKNVDGAIVPKWFHPVIDFEEIILFS